MGNYDKMILTAKGRHLQAKAEAGVLLKFTRVAVGEGRITTQNPANLEDLLVPKQSYDIYSFDVKENGMCHVRTHITNSGLQMGLFINEIGLYAQDPDEGEILYGYISAIESDYLPAEGGSTLINHQIDIIVIVGNAVNISAVIDMEGYVSQADFEALKNQITHIITQQEINDRTNIAKTNFFDTLDGTRTNITLLNAQAELTQAVGVGLTSLPIYVVNGTFAVGEEVTIFDDVNFENAVIASVTLNSITIVTATRFAYKKGAIVTRSTALINTADKTMQTPNWGTYTVSMEVS